MIRSKGIFNLVPQAVCCIPVRALTSYLIRRLGDEAKDKPGELDCDYIGDVFAVIC